MSQNNNPMWKSRMGFILAATGSAIGLGNVWKFPYIAGENGGGAFVLVYLLCIAAIGLPIMMAEVLLGRRTRQSPMRAYATLAKQAGASRFWAPVGVIGATASFLVMTFYAVVAGWTLAYVFEVGRGAFAGATAQQVGEHFGHFVSNPWVLAFWTTLLMWSALAVQSLGVNKGIERAVRIMMPGMLVMILGLVGYAAVEGEFAQATTFLFQPDFSKLSANGVLIALGHAFFTLGVAGGIMLIFGAYLPEGVSIARTAVAVAVADTLIALLAGMAIFPLVFANGLEPSSGPGLIFTTLPIAFGSMPLGTLIGTLFFVMLSMAAFTTLVSIVEAYVAWLVERGWGRRKATFSVGLVAWILSFGTVFSFNVWSEPNIFGMTFFDAVDHLATNIMLPLSAILITIFVGWVLKPAITTDELAMREDAISYKAWLWSIRVIAPVAIIVVFLHAIGVF
ncbi:MAG: transporter [Lysobacteraceae bacterium]|nr:MAG: transporter [Xanthomonadaceae bacterium]